MRRKMTFADLSAHVQEVFASMCKDGVTPEENYEGFKKLTYDLNHNPNEMFDENGNKKTKRDAEDAVRKFVYAIMGLNENSTKRDRNRAMKKHGIELFEVMEEEIDIKELLRFCTPLLWLVGIISLACAVVMGIVVI